MLLWQIEINYWFYWLSKQLFFTKLDLAFLLAALVAFFSLATACHSLPQLVQAVNSNW